MSDCLFDLHIGYVRFRNPIALAPMAGIVDSAFANQYAGDAGLVVLGAFNLDEGSIEVASKLAASVITSYSIHYTKLYDAVGAFPAGALPEARPHSRFENRSYRAISL